MTGFIIELNNYRQRVKLSTTIFQPEHPLTNAFNPFTIGILNTDIELCFGKAGRLPT
jgi:hypothetical protein